MQNKYFFPFGEPLTKVEQRKKAPKNAFVLGVYASAVHAGWIDKNGKEKVKALAVASEPEIFWRGENAENIISQIKFPKELGRLIPPKNKNLNGPSGIVLDELFLNPLGLNRENTWLCDLLPESRVNEKQAKALERNYTDEIIQKHNLKPATIPLFTKDELKKNSQQRKIEILAELEMSKSEILILLGDLPIRWFLKLFNAKYKKLSDFGETKDTYGKIHQIDINGKDYKIIALCHPRNAGKLGNYSPKWWKLHDNWVKIKNEN
jgi:hypothetical protein